MMRLVLCMDQKVNKEILDSYRDIHIDNFSTYKELDKKLGFWKFRRIKSTNKNRFIDK